MVDVFLGGSCANSTWRQTHAIPFCNEKKISFFNPQVETWTPDLIAVEYAARENAAIQFFVIDGESRGTVSMVEVAFLIGAGRTLLVVMNPLVKNKFHQSELPELEQSRELLKKFERKRVVFFSDMHSALDHLWECVCDLRNSGISPQTATLTTAQQKLTTKHFVCSETLASMLTLLEASYAIGQGFPVTLVCPEVKLANGQTLLENDYNRARRYICDLAERSKTSFVSRRVGLDSVHLTLTSSPEARELRFCTV